MGKRNRIGAERTIRRSVGDAEQSAAKLVVSNDAIDFVIGELEALHAPIFSVGNACQLPIFNQHYLMGYLERSWRSIWAGAHCFERQRNQR